MTGLLGILFGLALWPQHPLSAQSADAWIERSFAGVRLETPADWTRQASGRDSAVYGRLSKDEPKRGFIVAIRRAERIHDDLPTFDRVEHARDVTFGERVFRMQEGPLTERGVPGRFRIFISTTPDSRGAFLLIAIGSLGIDDAAFARIADRIVATVEVREIKQSPPD